MIEMAMNTIRIIRVWRAARVTFGVLLVVFPFELLLVIFTS